MVWHSCVTWSPETNEGQIRLCSKLSITLGRWGDEGGNCAPVSNRTPFPGRWTKRDLRKRVYENEENDNENFAI
jgi:hypothetical protein